MNLLYVIIKFIKINLIEIYIFNIFNYYLIIVSNGKENCLKCEEGYYLDEHRDACHNGGIENCILGTKGGKCL